MRHYIYSKREGLGMGRYRTIERHRLTRGIKWVPEGKWAIRLGVPVRRTNGNLSARFPLGRNPIGPPNLTDVVRKFLCLCLSVSV